MSVPQIQLQSTPARISISSQKAQQTIRQPKAEQTIQQPQAKISMEQKPGKLTINQTNAWHNLDLKNVLVRTEELVGIAKNIWMDGIVRVSQEGDELMRIENGGDPIASQAKRNSGYDFTFQPGGLPAHELVNLDYEAGKTNIELTPQKPIIRSTPHKPEHTYKPGDLIIRMAQYPELQIDWKV